MISSFQRISGSFATVNDQQYVVGLDLLRTICGGSNLLYRKEKIRCSCRAVQKHWKFLCHTSPTLDPGMGKSNFTTYTIDRAGLTVIRISDSSIPFPSDCINILRSRPFAFSARRCNKFSVDRVLLAGDAAHVFPPCKYLQAILLKRS
jgi:hypothetical protein